VTKRGAKERYSMSAAKMSLAPPCLSIEELEQRLEAALLRSGWAASEKGDPAVRACSESCGCLGILCLCDGQDCAGVCATHCLIHYV
jgi:hypothetical protein